MRHPSDHPADRAILVLVVVTILLVAAGVIQ